MLSDLRLLFSWQVLPLSVGHIHASFFLLSHRTRATCCAGLIVAIHREQTEHHKRICKYLPNSPRRVIAVQFGPYRRWHSRFSQPQDEGNYCPRSFNSSLSNSVIRFEKPSTVSFKAAFAGRSRSLLFTVDYPLSKRGEPDFTPAYQFLAVVKTQDGVLQMIYMAKPWPWYFNEHYAVL